MKQLFTILALAFVCASGYSQSNHTVTFTGSSGDFFAAEKFSAAANNTDYYITFDANNLYIGAFRTAGSFGTGDNLTIYLDTDPNSSPTSGTGTTSGQSYSSVTGTLPFSANYNVHAQGDYQEARSFPSSWGSMIAGVTYNVGTTWREVKIPFSSIGNPNALYITMWMGYSGGFYSNAPGADIAASSNPTIVSYFGGFGVSSADCIPKNTTNTPITDVITNTVPASGALYGKVVVNTGTVTATNNFNVAPGGSIEVSGGTFDISGRSINMGGTTIGDGKGTTINTSGSGALTSNSSTTLTFNGEGNITGNALSSAASFILNRKFTPLSSGAFTSTGIIQLNLNSFINTNAITYGTGSTLKYNIGAAYGRFTEWNSIAGAGYPYHVQISNNTTLDLSNGSPGTTKECAGDITIDAGSSLTLSPMTAPLRVNGNVINNGTLTLSSSIGGDIYAKGNWTRGASATFNANNRAVFFNGTSNQTITLTGGGTMSYAYLAVDKTAGTLILSNSPATSIDLTGTTGDVLQLNNTGGLDLNGQRLTITNTGTSIKLNSGNRSVTSTLSGGVFSITGGVGSVGITTPGTLTFGPNVTLGLSRGFNSGAAANVTVNGILQINANGYLDTNPVTYGPSSTLLYASGSYTVSNEWTTGGTVGAGVPFNVTLNLSGVTSAVQYITTSRTVPGNLTITQGELNADAALNVIGNVSMATNGLLDGSDVTVTVSGDWSANSTKSFNGYTAGSTGILVFNGTGTRTINHVGGMTTRSINFSNTGNYTINNDISIQTTSTLTISGGTVDMGTNALSGNGLGGGNLTMSGGTLKLGNTSANQPNFTGTFSLTGGTVELTSASPQVLRGNKIYNNLTFSGGGTKSISTATGTINGTVTIPDATTLDVSNNTFGGSSTNFTMSGNGRFRVSGTGDKPDMLGTYTLTNGTVEFYGGTISADQRIISKPYFNIEVTNIYVTSSPTAALNITINSGGSFIVKSTGAFALNHNLLDGPTGSQSVIVESGGTFKVGIGTGFSGTTTTAIKNDIETITLNAGSTIDYSRNNTQTITNAINYPNLTISGSNNKTLAGDVIVSENLNLNNGTIISAGFTINLAGNLTGTAIHSGTGKILMTGSGKTISGATLGNLELSNAGGFSLSGSPTISGVLTLTNGKLTLGGNDITLNSTASGAITGYDASKYIITNSTGLLKRKVTSSTTYDFPIGSATNYEPATITTGSTFATTTRLDARFISTDPTGPTPTVVYVNGTPIADFLNAGYWSITPDAALGGGSSYNITLTSNGHNNADTYLDYHAILKGDNASNTWAAPGTHVDPPGLTMTSLVDPITVSATGISSFSDFAIGKSNGYVLPIVLTNFEATLINADVWLQWNTASEVNNDYFEIQRSLDGSIWNTIGQVDGAGSTSVPQSYAFTDANAPGLILYYRLKQVDYNGDFDFSEIRVINNSGNQQYIVHGYYNVAGQFFQTLENAPAGIYLLVSNKGNSKILHAGK